MGMVSVLAQSRHSTSTMPLSRNRERSMGTTPENVHVVGMGGCFLTCRAEEPASGLSAYLPRFGYPRTPFCELLLLARATLQQPSFFRLQALQRSLSCARLQ